MLLSEIVDGIAYNIVDPANPDNDPDEVASELQMLIQKGGNKILNFAQSLHRARQVLGKGDS
jgi:hypothetical protein